MVQFLSIKFFSWISSIFVGVFKSSRLFVSLCICHSDSMTACQQAASEHVECCFKNKTILRFCASGWFYSRGKFCSLGLGDDEVTVPRISTLPPLACDMSASIDRLFLRLLFMQVQLCLVRGRIKGKCVNILFVNSFVNHSD